MKITQENISEVIKSAFKIIESGLDSNIKEGNSNQELININYSLRDSKKKLYKIQTNINKLYAEVSDIKDKLAKL